MEHVEVVQSVFVASPFGKLQSQARRPRWARNVLPKMQSGKLQVAIGNLDQAQKEDVRRHAKNWLAKNPTYHSDRRKKTLQRALVNGARWRAKRDGLAFNLAPSDVFLPKCCPILGIELFVTTGKLAGNSFSLDRIESSKGYVRGNVAVISMRANRLKSDGTLDEFRRIIAYLESPPVTSNAAT